MLVFFFQAEDGIRDYKVTGVQTCALPILALRAAGLEVGDPGQALRACTTVFACQVAAGPLDIHVSVLRRGRSATQVQAAVRNEGADAGASVVAVFGSSRRGPSFVDAVPP